MKSRTIFTLDAREHVMLEILKNHYNLTSKDLHREISELFSHMLLILSEKKIIYQDLKNALIPRSDRKEIAFVFDTATIESSAYGHEVFSRLFPLIEQNSCISVLCGDFIGEEKHADLLKTIFIEEINSDKEVCYSHHSLFFLVYLNNLSDAQFFKLNKGLKEFRAYIGYFDFTFSSPLKSYMSTILIRLLIINKMTILTSNEENEDVNNTTYPFEKSGYQCRGIETLPYGLFLSYKIEREIFPGYENDTVFAINSITENVFNISDFKLIIEENKLQYLLKEKRDNLERAGIAELSLSELEELIKAKINSNYIYNLSFLADSHTLKFNILIEVPRTDAKKPMKLTVALEYLADTKILRLILNQVFPLTLMNWNRQWRINSLYHPKRYPYR